MEVEPTTKVEIMSSVAVVRSDSVRRLRVLSALLAAIVVVDAALVGAPGLGLLAVPFAAAAIFFRGTHRVAVVALGLWAALFALIAINYALANGFDAPGGDLLFTYVGGPLSIALATGAALFLRRSR
jgi:hypothetical protein